MGEVVENVFFAATIYVERAEGERGFASRRHGFHSG
jgi:hypothetical protein